MKARKTSLTFGAGARMGQAIAEAAAPLSAEIAPR